MAKTKDAVKILGRLGGGSPARARIAKAKLNFEVAQMIYDARKKAGLSQTALAALAGTRQPVIARLEDAEYRGHSLTMLQRIAAALERRVEVRFVPREAGFFPDFPDVDELRKGYGKARRERLR